MNVRATSANYAAQGEIGLDSAHRSIHPPLLDWHQLHICIRDELAY